jgi:hypothetical protein
VRDLLRKNGLDPGRIRTEFRDAWDHRSPPVRIAELPWERLPSGKLYLLAGVQERLFVGQPSTVAIENVFLRFRDAARGRQAST